MKESHLAGEDVETLLYGVLVDRQFRIIHERIRQVIVLCSQVLFLFLYICDVVEAMSTQCYNLGTRPTNFSYPPETPSTVTITLLPPATAAPLPQPSAPVIPSSFMTAIPQIPVMWPTSHACHYSSMEYFQEPTPVTTENSDKDSPMRDRSPSPAAPAVPLIQLEAHEQPSPPWQAWLSQSGLYHPERRSWSPSSEEESAPK